MLALSAAIGVKALAVSRPKLEKLTLQTTGAGADMVGGRLRADRQRRGQRQGRQANSYSLKPGPGTSGAEDEGRGPEERQVEAGGWETMA